MSAVPLAHFVLERELIQNAEVSFVDNNTVTVDDVKRTDPLSVNRQLVEWPFCSQLLCHTFKCYNRKLYIYGFSITLQEVRTSVSRPVTYIYPMFLIFNSRTRQEGNIWGYFVTA